MTIDLTYLRKLAKEIDWDKEQGHKATYKVNGDGQRIWCCAGHLFEQLLT